MKNQTKVERTSGRELVASRIINGPSRLVFEAWTNPELFKKWWVPKSAPITLVSCEMDVRTGGTYRLVFSAGGQSAEFFGKYLEVTPHSRLVWTNDEGGVDAATITTVTFEEINGATLVSGPKKFCTTSVIFEIRGAENCAGRGLSEKSFALTLTKGMSGYVAHIGPLGLVR